MTIFQRYKLACPRCGKDDHLNIQMQCETPLKSDGPDFSATKSIPNHLLNHEPWTKQNPCSCSHCNFKGKILDFSFDEKDIEKLEDRIAILSDPSDFLLSADTITFETTDKNNNRHLASLTPAQIKSNNLILTPSNDKNPSVVYEFDTAEEFCRVWKLANATLKTLYSAQIQITHQDIWHSENPPKVEIKTVSSNWLDDLFGQMFTQIKRYDYCNSTSCAILDKKLAREYQFWIYEPRNYAASHGNIW